MMRWLLIVASVFSLFSQQVAPECESPRDAQMRKYLQQLDPKRRERLKDYIQRQKELEEALRRMEVIDVAALQYYSQFKVPPQNLRQLAPPTEGNAPTREASDLIPHTTASGEVNGYRFSYVRTSMTSWVTTISSFAPPRTG